MAEDSQPLISGSLDDFLQHSPSGPLQTAIGNNFYGINHRQQPSPVPVNKDNYGLTFFVRPQLNMQTNNLRNLRLLTPLLTTNTTSIPMIVRCTLDPRIMSGYFSSSINDEGQAEQTSADCPFVDNRQAFIPILTNHLKSVSGWPDITVPTTTSKEGAYQEVHSMVDGITANYTAYDIEATFRNSKGDPISALFYAWATYQSAVYEGMLMPYPDMLVENEIDYNTRIYRLVLDPSKKYIQKIAATGASFPTSLPMGSYFDYSSEKPYNDTNQDISIRFRCMGAMYQDPILVHEFNSTVEIFNPSMNDNARERDMIQIPSDLMDYFNNRGYARIDTNTYELQWYVFKDEFNKKVNALNNFSRSL